MKPSKNSPAAPNMTRVHDDLVGQILSNAKPAPSVTPALTQWFLWFAAALVISGIALSMMGRDSSDSLLNRPLGFLYVLTLLIGAGLAAWEAIASSIPGRDKGPVRKTISILLLVLIYALPFFLLNGGGQAFDPWKELVDGWGCFRAVSLVGLLPWALLGWRISKNAAFHPLWSGAWSGASAFLLGSLTVQMHCPNLEAGHVWMAHLMPVALFTLLAGWVGAYWFSRWRKP
jgi:hypothetical protein